MKPTVLVTAAAGNTGFPAAMNLLETGHPVRALVRRSSERTQELHSRGAEIVTGSMDDYADVRHALKGVQRAYFCPPLLPGLLDKAAVFAAAAEEEGLEFMVAMSQWLAHPAHPSIHTRQAWMAESVFRSSGVPSAFVNPGWFADNYLAAPELVTQLGVLPLPLGDGLNAPPSNEDIGAVVAAIVRDPADHVGRTYRPTGPDLLSPREIAATFARVTGHRVRYVDTPLGMFRFVSRSLGLPDYTAAQVVHYLADYQRGAFAHGGPTDVVRQLTGREPESLESIARRYLAPTPVRRGVRSRLVATARMFRGMLRGPANLGVISRPTDFAVGECLAANSPNWREIHQQGCFVAATPA